MRERAAGRRRAAGLLGDSVSVWAAQGSALALQFLTGVLLARWLEPAGRGAYAVAILVPTTVVALGGLGVGMAHGRLAGRGDVPARTLLGNVLATAAVLGTLYAGLAAVCLDPSWRWLAGVSRGVLLAGCAAVPFMLLTNYVDALLVGAGRLRARNALRAGAALLLAVAVGIAIAAGRLDVPTAVALWLGHVAITGLAAAALGVALAGGGPRLDLAALRPAFRHGLRGAASTACAFLLLRSDLFLVTHFLGPADAGRYAVAAALAGLVLMLPSSIGTAFLPRAIRRVRRGGDTAGPIVCRLTLGATLGLAVVAALVAGPFVRTVYGAAYAPAVAALLWLLPGVVVASVTYVLGSEAQGRGAFHLASLAAAAGLTVNVAANVALIPRLGIVGAAIASSIGYAVSAAVLLVWVSRTAGVPWSSLLVPRLADARSVLGARAAAGGS